MLQKVEHTFNRGFHNINETIGKFLQTTILEMVISTTTADIQDRSKTHSLTEIKLLTCGPLFSITNCDTSETYFVTQEFIQTLESFQHGLSTVMGHVNDRFCVWVQGS